MERKITSISNIGNNISVIFNDGESAVFHPFSNNQDIYTTTSPGVLKKTLVELKKDIKKFKWDVRELTKIWVEEKYRRHGFK